MRIKNYFFVLLLFCSSQAWAMSLHDAKSQNVVGEKQNGYLGAPSSSSKEVDELIEAIEEDTNKIHEAADVFYHLLMYLEANDVKIEEVMRELEKRKK